jgi:hypothetical protein
MSDATSHNRAVEFIDLHAGCGHATVESIGAGDAFSLRCTRCGATLTLNVTDTADVDDLVDLGGAVERLLSEEELATLLNPSASIEALARVFDARPRLRALLDVLLNARSDRRSH